MEKEKIIMKTYQKIKKSISPTYNDNSETLSLNFLGRRKIYGKE